MKYIAVDWDNTFTADPDLFRMFIRAADPKKFRCFFVTARHPEGGTEVSKEALDLNIEAVFCSGQPKIKAAEEQGVSIDIWIDDMPELLFSVAER